MLRYRYVVRRIEGVWCVVDLTRGAYVVKRCSTRSAAREQVRELGQSSSSAPGQAAHP